MEIPSKKKLRAQRIFSVSEAELFWNKNGDRLAAHTERYQKKNIKTSASGSIEEIKYTVSHCGCGFSQHFIFIREFKHFY